MQRHNPPVVVIGVASFVDLAKRLLCQLRNKNGDIEAAMTEHLLMMGHRVGGASEPPRRADIAVVGCTR